MKKLHRDILESNLNKWIGLGFIEVGFSRTRCSILENLKELTDGTFPYIRSGICIKFVDTLSVALEQEVWIEDSHQYISPFLEVRDSTVINFLRLFIEEDGEEDRFYKMSSYFYPFGKEGWEKRLILVDKIIKEIRELRDNELWSNGWTIGIDVHKSFIAPNLKYAKLFVESPIIRHRFWDKPKLSHVRGERDLNSHSINKVYTFKFESSKHE